MITLPFLFLGYAVLCFCFCLCRDDGHVASVFAGYFELYSSVYQGVQSVVTTHADVFARMELGTSLTDDDVACLASFTAEYFNA